MSDAKRGRPTKYSDAIAEAICARLASGESLRSICRDEGMPSEAAVRLWYVDDVGGFSAHYAKARDIALDVMADEILEIANTPEIGQTTVSKATGVEITEGDMLGHRRLQVDTRKWYLSKLAPKKYGDKQQVELSGKVTLETLIAGDDE